MNNFYDVWFSYIDLSNNIKLKLLEKYSTKEIFDLSFECNKKIEDKILNSKKLNLEKYFNYL